MEARVRMPLGANVPRRRPAADASSFISPPRTFAPAFQLARRSPVQAGKRGFYCKPAIHGPARPAGLRGKIKEEAFAAGGCRRTFAPKACRSRRARQIATRPVIDQEGPSPDLGEEPKKSHPYRAVRARPGWQTSL